MWHGWMTLKPLLLIPTGSLLPELAKEENQGRSSQTRLTWKTADKTEEKYGNNYTHFLQDKWLLRMVPV